MRNLKLTIAYDGSDYHGWQIQPGEPTVQGVVASVLRQITQEQITLHGAGRTDAGVHAWGQVANFSTASEIPASRLLRALNALLPPTIRIRAAEDAAPDFQARWLACAKTYAYRIYRGPILPPFLWRYVLHCPVSLDFTVMAEAARRFEGQHDFSSFAASSGSEEVDDDRVTERSIFRSELLPVAALAGPDLAALGGGDLHPFAPGPAPLDGSGSPALLPPDPANFPEWVYLIRGRSFLRNMVRKIVGTLLDVGRGRLTPDDVPRILALRNPAASGPTAPPHGLYLLSVEYPPASAPAPASKAHTKA